MFRRQGFLVVKDFFRRDELDPAREAINQLVDELAQKLFKAGKIKGVILVILLFYTTAMSNIHNISHTLNAM